MSIHSHPRKRGQAVAIYGIAVVVAPVVGPTLGGWISDTYSWHWVFLINVPAGRVRSSLRQQHENTDRNDQNSTAESESKNDFIWSKNLHLH